MSDWRAIRNRQHVTSKPDEENRFAFEDDSVDDDEEEVETVKQEEEFCGMTAVQNQKEDVKDVALSAERKEELVVLLCLCYT